MAQLASPAPAGPTRVRLSFEVETRDHLFLLEPDDMPETPLHDQNLVLLQAILSFWASRAGRSALVARNLACRWLPSDARVGVDPDICVVEPAPADLDTLTQLRLWEGHPAPWLGIEVVSGSTASKDYLDAPVRYARLGARELWVFDPLREGPSDTGGPFVLQLWERRGESMERIHAGEGPAWSPGLSAWVVVTQGGRRLRVAEDREGTRLWPTESEAKEQERQKAEAQQKQAQAERERAEAGQEAERQARERAEQAATRQAEAARQAEAGREAERQRRELAEAEAEALRLKIAALEARLKA